MTARMEPTFYDDALSAAFGQPEPSGYGYNSKVLKQSMTLNLSDPSSAIKPHLRTKAAELLTSPDVGLLKLASPELERLIIQSSNGMITTTPTPTQFLCPKNVTDEQEGFAEGFVRALAELHNQHTLPPNITSALAELHNQHTLPPNITSALAELHNQHTLPPNITSALAELHNQHTLPPNITSALAELHNQHTLPPNVTSALAELHNQNILPPNVTPAPQAPASSGLTPISSIAGNNGYNNTLHNEPPVYANLNNFNPTAISATPAFNGNTMGFASPHHGSPPILVQHPRLQALKEEPQTVPEMPGDTPPLSPIDMESQERIKAERKRMRNRIAASKCRKRKLERISRLEDKVKNLKSQNSELASTANMLREQVAQLKQKVMNHVNSGCQLMLTQQLQTF